MLHTRKRAIRGVQIEWYKKYTCINSKFNHKFYRDVNPCRDNSFSRETAINHNNIMVT